ncbi:MAG: hypothetical protein RLZZ611_2444 [Cyanobacteriota bacterium]
MPCRCSGRLPDCAVAAAVAGSAVRRTAEPAEGLISLPTWAIPLVWSLEWRQIRSDLVNAIKTRNDSLFVHGFRPVDDSGGRQLSELLGGFLQALIQRQSAQIAKSLLSRSLMVRWPGSALTRPEASLGLLVRRSQESPPVAVFRFGTDEPLAAVVRCRLHPAQR